MRWASLCCASRRVSRTLRCWTATRRTALARRFDPFVFLASDFCPGQRPRPDLRHPHPAGGDSEAVAGQPDRGPVVLAGPEPWVPHLAALARTGQGVEPVPVPAARVLASLHQSNRRDLPQPPTLGGGLGQGHDL